MDLHEASGLALQRSIELEHDISLGTTPIRITGTRCGARRSQWGYARDYPDSKFSGGLSSPPEGDQVMWFLPLPFPSAFVSQITPAMRKRFLAV